MTVFSPFPLMTCFVIESKVRLAVKIIHNYNFVLKVIKMIEKSLTDLLSFIVKVKKEANTVIISVNQNMSSMTSNHNKS